MFVNNEGFDDVTAFFDAVKPHAFFVVEQKRAVALGQGSNFCVQIFLPPAVGILLPFRGFRFHGKLAPKNLAQLQCLCVLFHEFFHELSTIQALVFQHFQNLKEIFLAFPIGGDIVHRASFPCQLPFQKYQVLLQRAARLLQNFPMSHSTPQARANYVRRLGGFFRMLFLEGFLIECKIFQPCRTLPNLNRHTQIVQAI